MYSVGCSNNYTKLYYGETLEAIIIIPILWVVMILLYLFLTKNLEGTKGIEPEEYYGRKTGTKYTAKESRKDYIV
tara:strand:- start:953 stop:1177 length:225 start_codon:yes stop_codon:yes gene_type:complete